MITFSRGITLFSIQLSYILPHIFYKSFPTHIPILKLFVNEWKRSSLPCLTDEKSKEEIIPPFPHRGRRTSLLYIYKRNHFFNFISITPLRPFSPNLAIASFPLYTFIDAIRSGFKFSILSLDDSTPSM